ncbi:MAG TPA: hypothetical protein VN698_04440 [Bacteroidia bacterium]|nr:hypothetical protein [Bacteroidia bacterium]
MIKKIAFIILLVAAIACGTWGYLYLSNLKRPTTNPLSVLPDTCYALIETKNLHQLSEKINQGNLMWEELLKADAIKQFNKTLQKADSLISNSTSSNQFGVQSVFVALYQGKKTELLAAFNLADINTNDLFVSFLTKNFAAKKTGNNVYECHQADYTFYTYANAGLVVFSGNSVFLQDAVKNNKTSLAQNKIFNETYQTEDKESDINLFIHLPNFYNRAWTNFFASSLKTKDVYGTKKEAWLSVDATISPSELNTQGFLSNDSSIIYNALKAQETVNFKDAFSLLPYNTLQLRAMSISKYPQFIEHNYIANPEKRKQDLQPYTDKINADAQTEIEKFIGDFAVLFTAKCTDAEQDYGLIQITEEKLATDFLKAVSDSTFDTADSVKVYTDAAQILFSDLCGRFFSKRFKYAANINNAILFSNEIAALSDFKKIVSEKNNLLANEHIVNFIDKNLSIESAFLFYADVFKCREEIIGGMSNNMIKLLSQSPEMFDKYESMALTVEKLKDNLFFKACANFNPKSKLYQNTLWETLLDTDLYINPTPVKNHLTNETELVCVDKANNLYLISNTGKILWRKNIGQKILGKIQQVDYFDNGKLQLLFNTENQLFVIDRNGNYVTGFPAKLNGTAIGGLTLFDYENNNNYRLWIPLKNNTTVCYAINGKPLVDFIPVKNTGQVTHLILQQKDYFVLVDTLGNINVTNRKGETRVQINSKMGRGYHSVFIEEGKNTESTNICYVNEMTKKLSKISLADKMQEINLLEDNNITSVFIDTLQNSLNPLLICTTENGIDVYDFFGKKLYERVLDKKMQTPVKSLLYKDKHLYAALENETNNLFLVDIIENKVIDTEIKLTKLPENCMLISNEKPYLVGFYGNKVFCIKQ